MTMMWRMAPGGSAARVTEVVPSLATAAAAGLAKAALMAAAAAISPPAVRRRDTNSGYFDRVRMAGKLGTSVKPELYGA
jgi:hypothetical protein